MRRQLCVRSIERRQADWDSMLIFLNHLFSLADSVGLRHEASLKQYFSMRGHAVPYLRACVGGYRRHRHRCDAAPTTEVCWCAVLQ